MSKARLVITAVVREGRSQGEVARASPRAIPDITVELIMRLRKELAGQGLDAGPDTIAWHRRPADRRVHLHRDEVGRHW
jgi:hypothetical protein